MSYSSYLNGDPFNQQHFNSIAHILKQESKETSTAESMQPPTLNLNTIEHLPEKETYGALGHNLDKHSPNETEEQNETFFSELVETFQKSPLDSGYTPPPLDIKIKESAQQEDFLKCDLAALENATDDEVDSMVRYLEKSLKVTTLKVFVKNMATISHLPASGFLILDRSINKKEKEYEDRLTRWKTEQYHRESKQEHQGSEK